MNARAGDGSTALAKAAAVPVMRALLEAAAAVDEADALGRTPLLAAVAAGFEAPAVRALLAAQAAVDVRGWNGRTPLMLAAHAADAALIVALLEAAAGVNAATPAG